MSEQYVISPDLMPALKAVIGANKLFPVALHQVGEDDRGFLIIEVKAYGDAHLLVQRFCEMSERGSAAIMPARHKDSDWIIGKEGDKVEFTGELYHIGVWTHPQYGIQYIHRLYTATPGTSGVAEFTWTTGKPHEIGEYKVTATVKGFTDFGGIKQTALKRCKLERVNNEVKRTQSV